MFRNPVNRIAIVLSAASLVGSAGYAQGNGNGHGQDKAEKQEQKAEKQDDKAERKAAREAQQQQRQAQQQQRQAGRDAAANQRQQDMAERQARRQANQDQAAANARAAEVQRVRNQQQRVDNREERLQAERQAQRAEQQRLANRNERLEAERAAQRQEAARLANRSERIEARRLDAAQQRALIAEQQRRLDAYNAALARQTQMSEQRVLALKNAQRMKQYQYQQDYYNRLRAQKMQIERYRNNYNYSNDPYFYTAPSYRYSRGGQYYSVNQYAADTLRSGVNTGYEEGYRAGQADRADGYRFDYRSSYAYEDANFGYTGMYVNQDEYNYYFRQGFQRGYEDGYYSRSQYGQYSNGRLSLLGTVLNTILSLQSLR